jgi:WD40 repeat protein
VLTGECLSVISTGTDFDNVNCLDIDCNGTTALTSNRWGEKQAVKVWNLANGSLRGELDFPTALRIQFTRDGQRAMTWNGTIKLWDLNTYECLKTIETEGGSPPVLSFDEEWSFGRGFGNYAGIEVYRMSNGALWKTINHPTRLTSGRLCISNDGLLLAACSGESVVCWQLAWVPEWEGANQSA